MNNSTKAFSSPSLFVLLAYASQGTLISAANLAIVLAIARYRALRTNKECVLMLGVSLADTVNQAGYAVSGIYSAWLHLSGIKDRPLKTISECMAMVHPLFLHYCIGLGPLMLLALSLDRMVCVLFPLAHVGWSVTYARRLIASVFLFKLADVLYFYSTSFGHDTLVSATCSLPEIRDVISTEPYVIFRKLYTPLFALVSVLIYFLVIFVFKRSTTPHLSGHDYELERQRRVTVTLWMSALCTLFLFVLPYSIGIGLLARGKRVGFVFFNLSNANHIASVFLYPLRHQEIVQALRAMLKSKPMPDHIRMWKESNPRRPETPNNAPRRDIIEFIQLH